jgi:hypothetical protein
MGLDLPRRRLSCLFLRRMAWGSFKLTCVMLATFLSTMQES